MQSHIPVHAFNGMIVLMADFAVIKQISSYELINERTLEYLLRIALMWIEVYYISIEIMLYCYTDVIVSIVMAVATVIWYRYKENTFLIQNICHVCHFKFSSSQHYLTDKNIQLLKLKLYDFEVLNFRTTSARLQSH